jgi:hypothetical protein
MPDTSRSLLPRILGALLRGQPEQALLIRAAAGMARLKLVNDRVTLVTTILSYRPHALVLPPFDADRTTTAPLVLRVRREAPEIAVLVLSSHPAGAGQPLLRAAQAGAHILTSASAAELHTALASLFQSREAEH